MQFHLPKPLHGWRAFVGEVGIIVLGVLIALGAQQLVEDLHQRSEVRDAEGAMVAELRDDNLPQAFTRAAVYNCYVYQLDRIHDAVASGDRAKVLQLAQAYQPVARTYDDQAWQAAVASQVLVHSGAKRMLGWATAYRLVPALDGRARAEQEELGRLYASIGGSGSLSPDQQDRLFQVLSMLRRQNEGMAAGSLVFISTLARQGLGLPTEESAAILKAARQLYGSCVARPAPERVDFTNQLVHPKDALQ